MKIEQRLVYHKDVRDIMDFRRMMYMRGMMTPTDIKIEDGVVKCEAVGMHTCWPIMAKPFQDAYNDYLMEKELLGEEHED